MICVRYCSWVLMIFPCMITLFLHGVFFCRLTARGIVLLLCKHVEMFCLTSAVSPAYVSSCHEYNAHRV